MTLDPFCWIMLVFCESNEYIYIYKIYNKIHIQHIYTYATKYLQHEKKFCVLEQGFIRVVQWQQLGYIIQLWS